MQQKSQDWHKTRAENVGASEVAALFNAHDYLTKYKLWHLKSGLVAASDLSKNDRVSAGNYFEAGIADWARDKWSWEIDKYEGYCKSKRVEGMGCTPDYITKDGDPVQIKFISDFRKSSEYDVDGDTIVDAPLMYVLQVMHEIACLDAKQGWLVCYLPSGKLARLHLTRRYGTISTIERAVASFWKSIEDNDPPPPDFSEDAEVIAAIRKETTAGLEVDLSSNNRLRELCENFLLANSKIKEATDIRDASKAEIFEISGQARKVKCGEYTITMTTVADSNGTEVTPEMVGTFINKRSGYRKINNIKKEGE